MSRQLSDTQTRIFFVTDSFESNEEIFETLEEAEAYFNKNLRNEHGARIFVALVRNAYREDSGRWNYDDYSDTFTFLSEVTT